MIKALLLDFARVLIFPVDKTYTGGINDLHKKVKDRPDFKFFTYFELNTEFMAFLETIKERVPLYMFTSESIQNDPAVKDRVYDIFKKVYSATEMGFDKTDFNAYKAIANDLKLKPEEILFIDDNLGNITASVEAGMQTVQYKDNSVIKNLESLLV